MVQNLPAAVADGISETTFALEGIPGTSQDVYGGYNCPSLPLGMPQLR